MAPRGLLCIDGSGYSWHEFVVPDPYRGTTDGWQEDFPTRSVESRQVVAPSELRGYCLHWIPVHCADASTTLSCDGGKWTTRYWDE